MMKLSIFLALAASAVTLVGAYTVGKPSGGASSTRRDWMASTLAAPTAAAVAAFRLPQLANAESLELFNDAQHGFSVSIPSTWSKTEQELNDRRKIVVWADPSDPKTALFIAYTPVRDDFTSLASFGPVDQVAAQTILPKGAIAGQEGVTAEMISSESKKQAYFFDYKQEIATLQPLTHFRTIFTLQQGATGGAGAVLVTITLQTPEARYGEGVKPLFDKIVDSYGKSV